MLWIFIISLLDIFYLIPLVHVDVEPHVREQMLMKVNHVRKNGCRCGKRYMAPAGPVKWDETLYKSALSHALDMASNKFFAHYSSDGLNIGDRLEKIGYDWQVVGENLGEGQKSFDEVLEDWMQSYSHCVMLMNPKVDEMAVARYEKYWVQHFGKKMRR